MAHFICPVCSQALIKNEKSYICKNRHSFDISAKGYVNLLPANKKHSAAPGDDKLMVNARNAFLSKGYYSHLRETLENLCDRYSKKDVNILDCGCGEGYYTQGIHNHLVQGGKNVQVQGIDISKDAVSLASKRLKEGQFAVASSFHLPISDKSVDVLINCFSPLCLKEFGRVLKKNGVFLYVVPAPKHLWQLKEALYEKPYENPLKEEQYDGFELVETVTAEKEMFVENNEDINNLFKMTPYVYRSPKQAQEVLLKAEKLTVNAHFIVYVYRKK
ncbi:MAG: methyltransferase domain-containing protein [Oscillospiraceae bacterium]|nr:methyltransferase domain-containing protein [Oscillospiraceae bacterium]